jgi:ketosteroid isomerase-like protein
MSRESALEQAAAVPTSVTRATIETAIHAFLSSYPAQTLDDVARRAALFADDIIFEDPVGAAPVHGKAALVEFFKGPMTAGMIINMRSDKIIVSGNEAISLTSASWGMAGQQPARVQIVHNFALNATGKITRVRIFFDEGCVQ